MIIQGFDPIAAPDAQILILGSMPGVASLEADQYYAHARNAFWPIMGELFGAGPEIPYAERKTILMANGIAVWDVLKFCRREGSLDADIRAELPNDFAAFFAGHPRVRRIGLNGGKATKIFQKFAEAHAPAAAVATRLPSTSPAYAAMSFARKCELWRQALLGPQV
ncbi:DNA-deoxyinosine glycosylase [uncultured Hyphomonas sp.]|uniref:DNA-deoxyinosine glycosylase n=1 Tax=uncultured Hyphomonas sp. TaxID=225298 RepID=UPI002AAAB671|nr:DNA-deoxyinosine glycosylase [uncultured Hyphomonas sp.]